MWSGVKFALDSLDDGSGAGDDGEHFAVGCFEVLDELLGLFVHAGLQHVEASCEISEQGEYGGEADDEEADEEPAVRLTAGVVRQLEEFLVHLGSQDGEGFGEAVLKGVRGGGPVAGGWGKAGGDHGIEPGLDCVELGRRFRGGVESELLVEERGGAVAAVALRICPFLCGEGRRGWSDPLAFLPRCVFAGLGWERGVVVGFEVAVLGPCGEGFGREGDEFVGC